jgi:hypothetical protein
MYPARPTLSSSIWKGCRRGFQALLKEGIIIEQTELGVIPLCQNDNRKDER